MDAESLSPDDKLFCRLEREHLESQYLTLVVADTASTIPVTMPSTTDPGHFPVTSSGARNIVSESSPSRPGSPPSDSSASSFQLISGYLQTLAGALTSAFILCCIYYCVRPLISSLYRQYPILDRYIPRVRVDRAVDSVIRRSMSNLNIPVPDHPNLDTPGNATPDPEDIEMGSLDTHNPTPAPRHGLLNPHYGFRNPSLQNN